MTYKTFTNVCKGLLLGDNVFPTDPEVQVALLGYACDKIANEADALQLFTVSKLDNVVRDGIGNSYVRKVTMPTVVNNMIDPAFELDLDDELCYPLARYFVSFVSKDKIKHHIDEAQELIRTYNSKVEGHMNKLRQKNSYESHQNTGLYNGGGII